jgi:hypothetical protein
MTRSAPGTLDREITVTALLVIRSSVLLAFMITRFAMSGESSGEPRPNRSVRS